MKLTDRDITCFGEFLDMGFLTAKQLVNLCLFPNEKKARDRLRLLCQENYLGFREKPYSGPGRAEYVYYINKKRRGDVARLLGFPREDICTLKPSVYAPLLLHQLAITDFAICIKQAAKELRIYEAEIIPEYKPLSASVKKLKKSLAQSVTIDGKNIDMIPDGVICLTRKRDMAKTLLFFEIYRGTQTIEGNERAIKHKVETYVAYLQQDLYKDFSDLFTYQFKGFRVLLIIYSVSYLEKLKKICSQLAPAGLFWLAMNKDIRPSTVFKPIWYVSGEDRLKAIVNLRGGKKDEKAT